RFAISACTAIAKVHPFVETPSSSIQHVKELSLLKFVILLQDTLRANGDRVEAIINKYQTGN
ncbi:MAG: hypothetical protein WC780_16425, partial [Lentimicrobiaceae bacterium]